jgi:hypothetical protein
MTTEVAGFIACHSAAEGVPLPGGPLNDTER